MHRCAGVLATRSGSVVWVLPVVDPEPDRPDKRFPSAGSLPAFIAVIPAEILHGSPPVLVRWATYR